MPGPSSGGTSCQAATRSPVQRSRMVLALRLVLLLAGPVGQGALAEASSAVASWTTPPSAQGEAGYEEEDVVEQNRRAVGMQGEEREEAEEWEGAEEADQIEGQGSDAPTGAQSAMKADIEPGASANAGAAAWPSTHHGRALSEAENEGKWQRNLSDSSDVSTASSGGYHCWTFPYINKDKPTLAATAMTSWYEMSEWCDWCEA
mmetsp:Transcript_73565/g.203102  ORF Transcript_73565/g.203102 Transcript_73565/m.203102 type:complete len:204 (+) Transcript_73565:158-769(+)